MRLVVFALAAFAVIYLVAANVILRTRMLRDLVSEGPDVELDYASAYSVWPGLVHVRGLALEIQDYHIQVSVGADSGVVAISLHDLLFRRFHATDVALSGLAFRFRTKVEPKQGMRSYVAAFPPIPGFADPPVIVGDQPPPVSDAEYSLWQIAIDEVDAELRELWILEYRYLGLGSVRGGFLLQPARHFAVYPAAVELKRGTLSIGEEVAASRLELELEGYVEPTDVRQVQGAALAEKMSGRLALSSEMIDLGVLDARSAEPKPWRLDGRGTLAVSAAMTRGRLEQDSSAELDVPSLALRTPFGKLAGAATSKVSAGGDGRIDWTTTSPKIALSNSSPHPGPSVVSPRLVIALHQETLGYTPSLRGADLDLPQLVVPSLGWAERWVKRSGVPIRVDGRMEGRARLSSAPGRGPEARVHLRLADAELSTERVHAALGGRVDVELEPVSGSSPSSRGKVEVQLDGVEVERIRERTKPFRAVLRLPDLKLALEPEPALSASVEAFATPADSLLSLALGSPMLEDLAADVFALKELEARAKLNLSPRSVKLELASAESGSLTGQGFWQRPAAGDSRGAFLISSKVANVGISLVGSDTETAWFVKDDWLSSHAQPSARPDTAPTAGKDVTPATREGRPSGAARERAPKRRRSAPQTSSASSSR
ncbi:MAG TPA: hypothetical protein VMG12_04905 [Polyangiaceae bacterium]|nr:hypothetical protein [Polyangiaceae bacterium]